MMAQTLKSPIRKQQIQNFTHLPHLLLAIPVSPLQSNDTEVGALDRFSVVDEPECDADFCPGRERDDSIGLTALVTTNNADSEICLGQYTAGSRRNLVQ